MKYTPPPLGVLGFVGRAAVIVEVAPNAFVQFILEIRHGDPGDAATITVDRDVEAVHSWDFLDPVRYVALGPPRADIHLAGRVISREEADRPSWAGPAGEIESRREIEA